uniref:tRNA (guanine-N(7)-)-methyltransferase n=1 Tax=Meloidogyne javanica TaxID=6303 RepID=A0A915NDN3_MELJA
MDENIPNCSQLNNESKNQSIHYPQKRFYRQRAHSNPLSDHNLVYPLSPEKMDWSQLFSSPSSNRLPQFADIGCGYGGLLVRLSPMFPDIMMGQLDKMFFLFPDPHFKKTKHKWRIISTNLLSEYAYVLRPGGRIYTITDVEEVHKWMVDQIGQHPLFIRLEKEEEDKDEIVPLLYDSTEEGQKVTRNSGQKWLALFQRLENP